ncbi:MAG: electron transfer flavoprotein subunit beta/FixA family protein [Thermodesulfobacteriota bacterium]
MKKILVCIKAVTDLPPLLRMAPDIPWVSDAETGEYRINRFDEFALEEAIRIREKLPHVTVDALSVGPDHIRNALRRAMAIGADNGIHIRHESRGFSDAQHVAELIAGYAATGQYDLILTGVMAEDDMQGLVGPFVADLLGLPCATVVVRQDLNLSENTIRVACELEAGLSELVELRLPALLSIQTGINRPRYPSLSNMLRSRTKELTTIDAPPSEKSRLPFLVNSIQEPVDESRCTFIGGSAEEKAVALLKIFSEKSLLRQRMGS